MRESMRHQLCILLAAGAVMFTNLGSARLWDQDEAFFARSAVEMHERHEWVVPYFNGELFAHKPPLMFWMMRVGYGMFGVNEFAARFWSAVFGIATALLTYHLGRKMFSARVGLWGGLAISTALMFDVVARAATPDSFLVFFCTLAIYAFARFEEWNDAADSVEVHESAPIPLSACLPMYLAMSLAVLVKGPIGVLLPGGTIGLYLLVRGRNSVAENATASERMATLLSRFSPARVIRAAWNMRPLTAIGIILLAAGPWFLLVGLRTHGEFITEFFGVQNIGRFTNAMDGHSGGVWYYMPAILAGFFPWSIFGIPTIVDLAQRCRGKLTGQKAAKFIACWLVVVIGFFSIASTKLPNYVLPAYPALALATAAFINRWLALPESVSRWWPRWSFGSLALVGGLIAAGAPFVAYGKLGGHTMLDRLGIAPELAGDLALAGALGGVLLAGGAACILLAERDRRFLAIRGFAAVATSFVLGLFAVLAVRMDRHQPSPAVALAIRQQTSAPQIAQFGYFRPSLVYYTDARVEACKTIERVVDFLGESNSAVVVTTDEHYARIKANLPADIVVLDRQPEFPRRGEVLVLGRSTTIAGRDSQERQ